MTTIAPTYHVPVLLEESIDGLDLRPSGIYVDATFGGGGHSREILRRLEPEGRLLGFDQDIDALANAPSDDTRFTFVRSNFRYLPNWLRYYGVESIDGLLADLGVSSHHFDDPERGFSFRFDAPLDMRMNTSAKQTAADVVNSYSEEKLAEILYLYGELKNSRRLASAIVEGRSQKAIASVEDFSTIIGPLLPKQREKKEMAKVFQALRIEVNHEMDALRELLEESVAALRPGGRLSVITYHSLEDRLVKNFMRSGRPDGKVEKDFFGNVISPLRPVNNKVIVPSPEEQERNPRSRSAKLRIAEKVEVKQSGESQPAANGRQRRRH